MLAHQRLSQAGAGVNPRSCKGFAFQPRLHVSGEEKAMRGQSLLVPAAIYPQSVRAVYRLWRRGEGAAWKSLNWGQSSGGIRTGSPEIGQGPTLIGVLGHSAHGLMPSTLRCTGRRRLALPLVPPEARGALDAWRVTSGSQSFTIGTIPSWPPSFLHCVCLSKSQDEVSSLQIWELAQASLSAGGGGQVSWELKSQWRKRSGPSPLCLKRDFVFSSKRMACGLGNLPTCRWGRRRLVLSRCLSTNERLKDTWWQGDRSCLHVVLPRTLPAFCSSSVILGTVGDLRPTPSPQPHRETVAQPSPHSGRSLLTAVLGRKTDFSPTQIWWRPGVKWWLFENAKFHRIPCPLGPSSTARGLAPGLTLSLIESELSWVAQIYKHMLASSSGTLASWPTSLLLSLWCPAGPERWPLGPLAGNPPWAKACAPGARAAWSPLLCPDSGFLGATGPLWTCPCQAPG